MTNPFPGSYTNSSTSNLAGPRRSSYASVAAGTASATNSHQQSHSPARGFGTISQFLRHDEPDMQRERNYSSYNNPPFGVASNMAPAKGGVERARVPMGYLENSAADDIPPSPPAFVCPSYLRNSRYGERLRAEHRAAAAAANQARRQGKHVYHGKDNLPSTSLSTSSSGVNLPKIASPHVRPAINDVSERLPPGSSEDGLTKCLNKLPSCWSETEKCPGIDILQGGLEVRFMGQTKTSDDAAAVRSDNPMPKEAGIFYFEVTILSRGKEGLIGIGFGTQKASLNRLPGWEPESWAYHGDDGFSFSSTASGKQYGPKFSSFDVIGCGVNFRTGSAFFTKNGIFIGDAFQGIKNDHLYPSVGMKKPGEHLRVNFGAEPFIFDIDCMMEREAAEVRAQVNLTASKSLESSQEERSLIQELIAQYLAHDGYVETARAFADDVHAQRESLSKHSQPLKMFDPSQDVHAINRQKIRSAILDGDIDKALKYLTTCYPQVLEKPENRDVYFKLRCRKFIEMMRLSTELQSISNPIRTSKASGKLPQKDFDHQMELDDQPQRESQPPTLPPLSASEPLDPENSILGGADESMDVSQDRLKPNRLQSNSNPGIHVQQNLLSEALNYGRELKAEFSSDTHPTIKQALQDAFALLAYTDARDSVVGGLMEGKGRIEIAEEVNAAILVSLGKPSSAALEKLCAQTEVLLDMVSADGGPAAFVSVSRDCLQ